MTDTVERLSELSKKYYEKGWMLATAGNLSFRKGEGFWVTASGKPKGNLASKDFVYVRTKDGEILQAEEGNRPSLEASIHRSIYLAKGEVGACLHLHTVNSTIFSLGLDSNTPYALAPIPSIEMIKAFGIWEEKPQLSMVVFYNYSDVLKISKAVEDFFKSNPQYPLPFLLIEGHGPTIWGSDLNMANQHLEATIFLFDVIAAMR